MNKVTAVTAKSGYKIHVVFSDGVEGDHDMSSYLWGEAFEPLKETRFFNQVTVSDCGTVCWPNEADLAPDVLHDRIARASGKPFKRWTPDWAEF